MITLTVFSRKGECTGFRCEGHAGYAGSGEDIICAAVSALTINCVNSVEQIAGDAAETEEADGFLSCRFPNGLSEAGRILVDSMLLGVTMTAETTREDGQPFVHVLFEEDELC